jgi:hypothetical protein
MNNNKLIENLVDRRSRSRGPDRRSEDRFKTSLPVNVYVKAEIEFTEISQLINISKSGARVRLRNEIAMATLSVLKFYIPRNDKSGYLDQQPINARSCNCLKIDESYSYFNDVGFFYLEKPTIIHGIPVIINILQLPERQ